MRRCWRRFVVFWSRRESATGLALFRVFLGLVTLYSLFSAAFADVVDWVWVGQQHGGVIAAESRHWLWSLLDAADTSDGTTSANVWALWWGASLGATLIVLGVGGRWPLLWTQQCYWALVSVNANSSGGYDALICIALSVLFLARSTETLSLDCWWSQRCLTRSVRVPAWPRYLLLIQLMVMYSATGFQKIGLSWTPMGGYTALHYVMYDPTWTRYAPTWVSTADPLLRVATAVSWHWEQLSILMLVVLYYRATRHRPGVLRAWLNRWDLRVPWALTGVGMHCGILLLMNVGPFSWISMSYYVLLWSGGELDRAFGRLRQQGGPLPLPEPRAAPGTEAQT